MKLRSAIELSLVLLCILGAAACSGDDGKDGMDGADGADGMDGLDGEDGADGTDGVDGDDGANGMDGMDGEDGTNGTNGADGADGANGTNGTDGADGMDGMDGESGFIDLTELTGEFELYDLVEVDSSGVSGQVRFAEFDDGSTLVTISVTATGLGDIRTAHIHDNSAAEGGPPAVTLNRVDGATGISQTVVTQLNDGTAITYDELLDFDGYVNVHVGPTGLDAVAEGDIGSNAFTGQSIVYDLTEVSTSGVTGTVTLEERINGSTLLTIEATGVSGSDRLAHIHAAGGAPIVTLENVSSSTGISVTNIRELDDDTAITFQELVLLDAYVNVHVDDSSADAAAEAGIGSQALTGNSTVHDLAELNTSGISGTATVHERSNLDAIIEIELTGTAAGSFYLSHIHENDAATGGPAVVTLASIDGDSGRSVTVVPDSFTYAGVVMYDGHINVHDPADPSMLVAAGDIGSND